MGHMPRIQARQRQIPKKEIGFLYAAPIASLRIDDRIFTFRLRRVILFHPEDNYSASGAPGTIIDSYTASRLKIKVGDSLTVAVFDDSTGLSHDLSVTVTAIVDGFPRWYIKVAASELAAEFSFNPNPLWSEKTLTLKALVPTRCY